MPVSITKNPTSAAKAAPVQQVQPSFLKTGAAAKAASDQAEAEAKAYAESKNKLWRFTMTEQKNAFGKGLGSYQDRTITFLDGALDNDGLLSAVMFREHQVYWNGRWNQFPCVAETEPCPLCELGNRASLVAAYTIIDHTPYTVTNPQSPNKGKTFVDRKMLYVPKRTTQKQLQKIATKNGGLVGCTFEVSRTGEKEASVGNMFQLLEKRTMAQLKASYGRNADGNPDPTDPANYVSSADYGAEITYHTGDELRKMGLGNGAQPIGHGDHAGQAGKVDAAALKNEL